MNTIKIAGKIIQGNISLEVLAGTSKFQAVEATSFSENQVALSAKYQAHLSSSTDVSLKTLTLALPKYYFFLYIFKFK